MQSNTNNALLSNYNQFLTQQEEDERERRLLEKEEATARRVNAQEVANMVNAQEAPVLLPQTARAEELERQRRLENRDECVARKAAAQDASNLIQDELDKPLTFPMLNQLEEEERQRRLFDHDEAVARKSHGQDAADAIRRESATIKARFVKRPTLWNKIAHNPAVVGRVIYNNLPSYDAAKSMAGDIAHTAASTAGGIASTAASTAGGIASTAASTAGGLASTAASTAASYIPSFASLMHTAHHIKDVVMHKIPFVEHPLTLADIKAAEELERQRRIAEDRSSSAVGNARRLSQIVRFAQTQPLHKAYPSGFHRYTNNWEERERTRRLANRGEMENRRMLACRVSNCVNQLGWPFIRNAKGNVPITPSAALAEEERNRILGDQTGMINARFGAKKLAGFINDAFAPFDHNAMSRFTRNLEEKERRHRMRHPDEAVHQAHRTADLIRNIGAPFYVPSSTIGDQIGQLDYNKALIRPKFDTLNMTNARLQARKAAKHANKAQSPKRSNKDIKLSQEVSREMPRNIDTRWMEEDERKARLGDKALQQLAVDNAHKVSSMINKAKGPYKQRQISFKPDVEIIPALPSNISPSTTQLYPMQRPVATVQPSTVSPSTAQLYPMQHPVALVQPSTVSPSTAQLYPMQRPVELVQPSTISPSTKQLPPMARTVAAPLVQPAQFSQPVELPAPAQLAKVHTATALPGSPYPERIQSAPLYQSPFANITPLPTHNLMQTSQPSQINSPALVPPGPVSQFVFPEQQQQQPLARSINSSTPSTSYTFPQQPVQSPSILTHSASGFGSPVGLGQPASPAFVATPVSAPAPVLRPVSTNFPLSTPSPLSTYSSTPSHVSAAAPAPVLRTVSGPVLKPVSTTAPVSTFAPSPAPFVNPLSTNAPVSTFTPSPAPFVKPVTSAPVSTTSYPQPINNAAPAQSRNIQRQAPVNPGSQQKLIESVQKLYNAENSLAEKEKQKMLNYQQKDSGWARFRAQRHAAAAARHSDNAKRHQDWLGMVNPGQSAL